MATAELAERSQQCNNNTRNSRIDSERDNRNIFDGSNRRDVCKSRDTSKSRKSAKTGMEQQKGASNIRGAGNKPTALEMIPAQ